MSAIIWTASGLAKLRPAAFKPPKRLRALGPVVLARTRLRQFLDALSEPPGDGSGGKGPAAASQDPWEDPAMWMLMFH